MRTLDPPVFLMGLRTDQRTVTLGIAQTELDVLTSLCRPAACGEEFVASTAREIASDLVMTEISAESRLLQLYEKFGIPKGPTRGTQLAKHVLSLGFPWGLAPSTPVPRRSRWTRQPGRVTLRLVDLAAALLPATARARYREEWAGLMVELPTRRARARQAVSLLAGAPRQTYTLRRPLTGRRSA